MNGRDLLGLLGRWLEAGDLAPLDVRFGHFVADGSGAPALGVLAALVSRRQGEGHVCLERTAPPALEGLDEALWARLWQEALAVGPPWLARLEAGESPYAPLVWEYEALWLGRLRAAEQAVAEALLRRLAAAPRPLDEALLARLYPAGASAEQRAAAQLAATRRFAVVTGGPGTGKTTTVLRVLLLRLAHRPEQLVRLLAPTGKAAARLAESLRAGLTRLRQAHPELAALLDRIPLEVSTLHRALGMGPRGPRYHRHEPLLADLVVVDEASMADLAIVHRLLEALPPSCDLILLGDPDQLASVEAGSVLADLVAAGEAGGALAAHLAALRTSHRFRADRGIGQLADALRRGDCDWDRLQAIAAGDEAVRCLRWDGAHLPEGLLADWLEDLDPARADGPEAALARLDRARILCALRQGPAGVAGLNQRLGERLGHPLGRPSHGQPVLVTHNAPDLGVFNGDMGVLWRSGEGGRLQAWFPSLDEIPLRLPLQELPEHEPAWALTVHKSQGSEYDRVLLVLPPEPHPLVTRELIYTAVTRARRHVCILAGPAGWNQGVARRAQRASRLRQRLLAG